MLEKSILEVEKDQRDLVIHVISQRLRRHIIMGEGKVVTSLEYADDMTRIANDLLKRINFLEDQWERHINKIVNREA